MTNFGTTPYKIRSTDPRDLMTECNRVFELIGDRLDKIEGHRGEPRWYARQTSDFDMVHTSSNRGLVLRDNADPANYWRITINSAGTLVITNLGRSYT